MNETARLGSFAALLGLCLLVSVTPGIFSTIVAVLLAVGAIVLFVIARPILWRFFPIVLAVSVLLSVSVTDSAWLQQDFLGRVSVETHSAGLAQMVAGSIGDAVLAVGLLTAFLVDVLSPHS